MSRVKKVLVFFGGIFLLLFVLAATVPFFVDVDQYRSKILEVANENVNGKVELGKLSLSLWGRILIRVDGVKLSDALGEEVFSVEEAFFHLPFSSVLTGSPELIFKVNEPKVNIVKKKDGKVNLLTLVKSQGGSEPKKEAGENQENVSLPVIVTRARLGIELRNALILYRDQATKLVNELKNFNIVVRDISLSRPMEFGLWSDLNTKVGEKVDVHGPFQIDGKIAPKFNGSEFANAQLETHVNFDSVEVRIPGTFEKSSNVKSNLSLDFTVSPTEVKIETFAIRFHNAEIKLQGVVKNLSNVEPSLDLQFQSNPVELGPWSALFPQLKEYQLSGKMNLGGLINGFPSKLGYRADVGLQGVEVKSPQFKSDPSFDLAMKIETDQVKSFKFSMKAPGNDLTVDGKLVSFSLPQIAMNIGSKGLDLDQLMVSTRHGKKTGSTSLSSDTNKGASSGKKSGSNSKQDYDQALESVRKNPIARGAGLEINTDIKSLKSQGITIKDIRSKFVFKNLVAALESFSMRVFEGKISMQMSSDLNKNRPSYQIKSAVNGLDLKSAVTSQMELFKNTFYGKFNFNVQGSGKSFNPDLAKKNLILTGKMKIQDAEFASIDVGRMTKEALNKGLDKVASKFPQAKGKKVGNIPGGTAQYETITSSFRMKDGEFHAPDFFAKSKKNEGLDIKGDTRANLITDAINAKWNVVDSYNLTKAKDVSFQMGGTQVNHVLAEPGEPVSFPVTVGCKMEKPCYSYGEVPGHFASVAGKNVTRALKGKAQAEANKRISEQKKKVQEEIKKKAPENVKKVLKKLPGGFF